MQELPGKQGFFEWSSQIPPTLQVMKLRLRKEEWVDLLIWNTDLKSLQSLVRGSVLGSSRKASLLLLQESSKGTDSLHKQVTAHTAQEPSCAWGSERGRRPPLPFQVGLELSWLSFSQLSMEVWIETWPLTWSWAVAASIFCRVCSTVDEDMEIGALCLNHLISSHIQDSCKRSHEVISSSKPGHDLGCGSKAQQGEGNLTSDVCSPVHFQIHAKQLFDLCPIGKRSEC